MAEENNHPPPPQLLRRTQVESMTGLGRSTIYALMRKDDFPTPIRIGPKSVRWKLCELEEFLENCPRANGDVK